MAAVRSSAVLRAAPREGCAVGNNDPLNWSSWRLQVALSTGIDVSGGDLDD